MKTIAFILSLLVGVLATFPFCLFDNCPGDKEQTSQVTTHEHSAGDEDGCGTCSPFCACSTCLLAIDQFSPFFYSWKTLDVPIHFREFLLYEAHFTSAFFHSFWHPPKLG